MRTRRLVVVAVFGGLATYAVAWPVAFGLLVGNWTLAPRYFAWSWAGGGERVAYLQLFALIAAGFGALVGLLWALAKDPR